MRARLETVIRLTLWTLVGLWALSSLWYPFGWDQGIFAWVGETILHGGMPYRDAFDLKGPAAHAVFAVAQALFGHNQWGIRLIDVVGIGAAAWLAARVVRAYAGPDAAGWAAAILILWYAGLTFWHTAQPDGLAATFLCLGFLPALETRALPSLRHSVAAGLATGIAIAIKPTYAAFLVVPTILILGRVDRRPVRAVGPLVALVTSTLLPVAGFLLWFASRDALGDLWEVYISYNAGVYSSGSAWALGPRLEGLFEYILRGNVFPILLPPALVGAWVMYRTDRTAASALGAWAVIAVATVVLQNKFFEYQWAPLFAPVVILGAAGFHAVLSRAGDGRAPSGWPPDARRGLGVALFAVLVVHASVHPAFDVLNWGSYIVGLRDKASYYDTFGVPGNDFRMSERIRSISEPGDRLFIMAWNAELLYTTGLESPGRFGYSLPFWMGEGTAYRSRYRSEAMDDLLASPPDLIVVAPQAVPLLGRTVSLEEFPEFVRFLRDRYAQDSTFGDLVLYRLR